MKVHSEFSAVGGYTLVLQDPTAFCPAIYENRADAVDAAERRAREVSGRRVFVCKVENEYQSVLSVTEVVPK